MRAGGQTLSRGISVNRLREQIFRTSYRKSEHDLFSIFGPHCSRRSTFGEERHQGMAKKIVQPDLSISLRPDDDPLTVGRQTRTQVRFGWRGKGFDVAASIDPYETAIRK